MDGQMAPSHAVAIGKFFVLQTSQDLRCYKASTGALLSERKIPRDQVGELELCSLVAMDDSIILCSLLDFDTTTLRATTGLYRYAVPELRFVEKMGEINANPGTIMHRKHFLISRGAAFDLNGRKQIWNGYSNAEQVAGDVIYSTAFEEESNIAILYAIEEATGRRKRLYTVTFSLQSQTAPDP